MWKKHVRVLHIIDQHQIGGPGKTLINTARYQDVASLEVHIAAFVPSNVMETEFTRRLIETKIPFVRLADGRGISISNVKNIIRYVKEQNIDILHTHAYKADFLGVLTKMFLGHTRLVTTYHGWITNTKSQKIFSRLDLLMSYLFDGIITVSDDLRRGLPDYTRKKNVHAVIRNALVLSDYTITNQGRRLRRIHGIQENDIVVGAVGRLSPEKGCLELLDAFNLLASCNESLKLIYVGEGPLKEILEMKILELGLSNRVVLAGYQNPVQLFYEAMDILVSPSYTEGLSNVILEAFAKKLPVIATNVGGNSEIITNGVNGILVKNNAAPVLGEALRSLLMDGQVRRQYGEQGYNTVKTRFDFKDRVIKEKSFYERLLRENAIQS